MMQWEYVKGSGTAPGLPYNYCGGKNENMDNWDWLYNRSQTLELNQEPPKKRSANRCNAEFGFCVR